LRLCSSPVDSKCIVLSITCILLSNISHMISQGLSWRIGLYGSARDTWGGHNARRRTTKTREQVTPTYGDIPLSKTIQSVQYASMVDVVVVQYVVLVRENTPA
jgi:hypothetical protein